MDGVGVFRRRALPEVLVLHIPLGDGDVEFVGAGQQFAGWRDQDCGIETEPVQRFFVNVAALVERRVNAHPVLLGCLGSEGERWSGKEVLAVVRWCSFRQRVCRISRKGELG